MTKTLKPEFQPGGAQRHVILDKAVQYLLDPRFGLQGDKNSKQINKERLSETEYLEALNRATNGELVRSALGD